MNSEMISCGDANQKNPSTLIGILNHKQTVNTKEIFYLGSKSEKSFWHWQNPLTQTDINFIRDFLLGSKIIEIFQALIRILSHKQSVQHWIHGRFSIGAQNQKIPSNIDKNPSTQTDCQYFMRFPNWVQNQKNLSGIDKNP